MNNLNLNLLKYFYYIVVYNGFNNAARNLNITQSALSYNIKQLETQLDKKLINRNSKTFELTEDGYELFETIKGMFKNLDNGLEKYSKNSDELVIGVRHSLSDFIFKDSIENFIMKYPNVHLVIKLYSKLDPDKFSKEYDILIDYDDYTDLIPTENKETLCSLENVFAAGRQLSGTYENVNQISDLENCDFISMCPNKKNGKFQKMLFDNGVLFNNIISINSSLLCKKLIKNNVGVGFINKNAIIEELASNEIKILKVENELFKDNVMIVYKGAKNITNINNFIFELRKTYKEENNE